MQDLALICSCFGRMQVVLIGDNNMCFLLNVGANQILVPDSVFSAVCGLLPMGKRGLRIFGLLKTKAFRMRPACSPVEIILVYLFFLKLRMGSVF